MPAFNCLSCSKPVPDQAEKCPHCAADAAEMLATLEKREEERMLMEAFAGNRMAENAARSRRAAAATTTAAPKPAAAAPVAAARRAQSIPSAKQRFQVESHTVRADEPNRFLQSIAPGSLFRGFSVVAGLIYFSAFGGKPIRDVAGPLVLMTAGVIAVVLVIDYIRFRPARA